MKKANKVMALICAMALVVSAMFALTACNNSPEEKEEQPTSYNFSACQEKLYMNDTDIGESSPDFMAQANLYETTMNNLYKDSVITVNNKALVWKNAGTESNMTVTKADKKYNFSGALVDQMKSTLNNIIGTIGYGSEEVKFEFYGQETENGFEIIESATVSIDATSDGQPIKVPLTITIKLIFTK